MSQGRLGFATVTVVEVVGRRGVIRSHFRIFLQEFGGDAVESLQAVHLLVFGKRASASPGVDGALLGKERHWFV